ncbi:MAG: discoidin domain-containing protein [Deltaproteobacteria bacterium]|nr:discoidin domain-containing protein [Deltaproteobacteria bacterium]
MLRNSATAFTVVLTFAFAGIASAQICSDQVPTLTGNTSAVSTSGIFSSSYPAWKAFDGSNSSMWISQVWETPAWIAYNFGSARVIDRYTITNTNGSLTSRAPKDFTLQGSNNGSLWATLDTRSNQTGWVSGTPRSYTVANPGSYSRYRLHITDDNDFRAGVVVISIGNLQFESCSCPDLVPTLTGNSSAVSTSGIFSSSYPAWKAFDGSNSSMWISQVWETPAWIAYNFGSSRRVTQYSLNNTNGSLTSRAPKNFTLQGSNNGFIWLTLDTRNNQTGWVSGTPRTYTVANPGNFSRYRLHITDDNDSRLGVVVISLGNLEFRDCS